MKVVQKSRFSDMQAVAYVSAYGIYIGAEDPSLETEPGVNWYMRSNLTREQAFEFATGILAELIRTT